MRGRLLMPLVLTVPRFALANLLAGEEVFPEHANPAGDAAGMAAELEAVLGECPERERVAATLHRVHERLVAPGAHERVAAVVEGHLA